MRSVAVGICLAALLVIVPASLTAETSVSCQFGGRIAPLPGLWEASGVAAAAGSPSRLWVINDSEQAIVYSVDLSGQIVGRVAIAGAQVDDWEDLAIGPCPEGRCLFIADVGDNLAKRSRITIYRVPEPAAAAMSTVAAQAFHGTYPDGAHNAESIFVDGDGRVYVITKGRTADVYRFPAAPASNSAATLEKVASLTLPSANAADGKGKRPTGEPATGAALSADRRWVAIRSNRSVWFFRATDLLAGKPGDSIRVDVSPAREPQGEAIAFGPGGTIYLVGEGGSKGRPGTLTSMTCALPQ
jgi:hypothetical protein